HTADLQVRVTLNQSQLGTQPLATVTVTRGIASGLGVVLGRLLDPATGRLKAISDGLQTNINDINTEIQEQNNLIASRRQSLVQQFTPRARTGSSGRNCHRRKNRPRRALAQSAQTLRIRCIRDSQRRSGEYRRRSKGLTNPQRRIPGYSSRGRRTRTQRNHPALRRDAHRASNGLSVHSLHKPFFSTFSKSQATPTGANAKSALTLTELRNAVDFSLDSANRSVNPLLPLKPIDFVIGANSVSPET